MAREKIFSRCPPVRSLTTTNWKSPGSLLTFRCVHGLRSPTSTLRAGVGVETGVGCEKTSAAPINTTTRPHSDRRFMAGGPRRLAGGYSQATLFPARIQTRSYPQITPISQIQNPFFKSARSAQSADQNSYFTTTLIGSVNAGLSAAH